MRAIRRIKEPLTWAILACLVFGVSQADVLKYGTRLRPPTIVGPPNCITCDDVPSKSARTPSTDPISAMKLDSQTSGSQDTDSKLRRFLYSSRPFDQPDSDESPIAKDADAKLRTFLYAHENADVSKASQDIDAKLRISPYTSKQPLVKNQQTASPIFSEIPKDNPKRGATFFFTQVEPHRFEYRAMFQHRRDAPAFEPFVHDFDAFSKGFPPLPKLPDFFGKDPFPDINEFSFPTLPPSIKRIWQPTPREVPPLPVVGDNKPDLGGVLGQAEVYPKIFRFNDERVNIEHFDREKKLRFYSLGQNELLEPENVKRDQLLILHGGVFTVQEPPVYKKYPIKKRRKPGSFGLYHRPLRL